MAEAFRVLLADHLGDGLGDVHADLVNHGYGVTSSQNLGETVRHLSESSPDLLILRPLSRQLPAFEVQHTLRLLSRDGDRPVLFLLEEIRPLEDYRSLPGGPLDFLVLPASTEEIHVKIGLLLAHRTRWEDLQARAQTMEDRALRDFKTGLSNDRFFFERLEEELSRSNRHGLPLSVVMFDLDDFKKINDEIDHLFGDFVLRRFAERLEAVVRRADVAARLGGDEFVLLLPNTDLSEATQMVARLRKLVREERFEKDGHSAVLGLSVGIDSTQGHSDLTAEEFLRRADAALLEAKRRGKGRTCLSQELDYRDQDSVDPSATLTSTPTEASPTSQSNR